LENKSSKESNDSMSVLASLIPDPVVMLDNKGKIVVANSLLEEMSGYNKEQLIGKTISSLDFISKEHRGLIEKNRKKRFAGFKIAPYQVKMANKNGDNRYLEIKGNHIINQGQELDLVIFHDVTAAQDIKNKLRCVFENQERIESIINGIKEAIILVDDEARVTYWNPAAEKMFGYTSREAVGKIVHKLVVPKTVCKEAKARINSSVKTFAVTGTGYFTVATVQLTGRRKDDSEFPAELSISPIKLGEKWGGVAVVKDITQRKQDEQKIREAEQRYHALFNQAPVGVLVVDPMTAECVEFNEIAHTQLGYSREEFTSKKIFDLEAKETPQGTIAHLNEMIKSGGDEFETLHKTKNGEIRNVIVISRAFQSADKTFLHAIFYDITKSKKVENALRESEAKYRQLVELAQEGIWAIDNDFVTIFVNPRMAQMLGYKESEMIGKSLFDFVDMSMVSRIRAVLTQYTRPDMRGQHDYAFPHKAGDHIDTTVNLSVITDDKNRKMGILAVVSDMTQRKRIEKELKESEERFRAISTSAIDGIILSDANDSVLYWNPAAEKMFGFSSKEAIGKKLAELVIPPNAHEKHERLLSNLNNAPISRRYFGLTALRKNGTKFPMDLSMVCVKLKDKKCLLTIVRDITEWKKMEEALKRERDLLESVAASNDASLSIVNRDYRIIWANKRSKQVTGCNDIENKYCFSVFCKNTQVCQGCGVKKVFEEGVSVDRHDYHGHLGNQDYWLELIATPIRDKEGNVVAALEVAMDITERKTLQNKLAEYSQKLEDIVQKRTEQLKQTQAELVKSERLAAIGELAGMIGHDLRNPLTVIKNATYYLKKKDKLATETQKKEMLQTIDKCVNYSNKVINDLLDYSKEIHIDQQECSPRQLIAETLTMVNLPENIKIVNTLPDNPRITVDPEKMQRVFINLTKNAIDALPHGGKISIKSKVIGDNIQISFSDNGTGINKEVLPKLFAPLFTTKAQGMGFGLAICKRIIEAHGGTISVNTVKDRGTAFVIKLPIEQTKQTGGEIIIWRPIIES
jgi:PAS domain S-box-containing protein